MDPPSAQLHQEVRDAVTRQLEHRRPILHHLNADSSWLLQIPRPVAATKKGGRAYYNILIDPWLAGGQSDVARWFSQQWHRFESACKSIAEVEELAREVEILASGLRLGKGRQSNSSDTGADTQTFIDAVAISHEFTDHCHRDTLEQIDRFVPVFASEYAARLLRNWKHFHHVETIPVFERDQHGHPHDWRAASIPPLPEWLSISRLQEESDNLYYHSALVFTFALPSQTSSSSSRSHSSTATPSTTRRSTRSRALPNGWIPESSSHGNDDDDDDDAAECVIYTPHGVRPQTLEPILSANPPVSVLALIHGLHDVAIDAGFWWEKPRRPLSQLNLGGVNGVRVQRLTRARYWIGTHDEVKWGAGLVNWFLRRKVVSVEEAVRAERERLAVEAEEKEKEREEEGKMDVDGEEVEWEGKRKKEVERLLEGVRFEEVGNGESRVLL